MGGSHSVQHNLKSSNWHKLQGGGEASTINGVTTIDHCGQCISDCSPGCGVNETNVTPAQKAASLASVAAMEKKVIAQTANESAA